VSVIEMFKLSNRDERLVVEANKVYTIGYFILTIGLALDIYYGFAQVSVVALQNMSVNLFNYFNPFEFLVFMTAHIVCIIVAGKRGILETNRYIDTESFPKKYYLIVSGLAAVAAGLVAAMLRVLAESQILGVDNISWLRNAIVGLVVTVTVFFSALFALYINYRAVKHEQTKILYRLDTE